MGCPLVDHPASAILILTPLGAAKVDRHQKQQQLTTSGSTGKDSISGQANTT